MATLLLLNSCRYLRVHPDRGGGSGAGVIAAPGVAARGASPADEGARGSSVVQEN